MFWDETDPALKAEKRRGFLTDLSLIGGLVLASADAAGKPSLGWRGRRAGRRVAERVSAALPSSHDALIDAGTGRQAQPRRAQRRRPRPRARRDGTTSRAARLAATAMRAQRRRTPLKAEDLAAPLSRLSLRTQRAGAAEGRSSQGGTAGRRSLRTRARCAGPAEGRRQGRPVGRGGAAPGFWNWRRPPSSRAAIQLSSRWRRVRGLRLMSS